MALEVRLGDFSGRSAAIQLQWRGATLERGPSLYLLAVGVSEYKYYGPPLKYAHCDANDFAAAMRGQEGIFYDKVEVRTLPNEKATCAEIMGGIEWLAEQATSADVAIVFLSGHGLTDRLGSYYFLPHNVELSNLQGTSVTEHGLVDFLNVVKARNRILFVDSCHAGGAADALVAGGAVGQFEAHVNIDRFANELAHSAGFAVVTSSTGTQESVENDNWKNGAFTEALLEGLAGKADCQPPDRMITMYELIPYVEDRVEQLSGHQQTPKVALFGTNFEIAHVQTSDSGSSL